MMQKLKFPVALLVAVLILPYVVARAEDAPAGKADACPGLNYQADKCECGGDKCEACACGKCTADEKCQCIAAARAAGGTIKGTVRARGRVKTKGPKSYKDVVVYLAKVGDNDFPAPVKHAKMDQKGLVYIPHVLPVLKGTTVDFLNSDTENHNVFSPDEAVVGEDMDLGQFGHGKKESFTFDKPGEAVMLCKLHLEMAAYIVVLENPFFTMGVIDPETRTASYTLKNVPPGEYTVKVWHKKYKAKSKTVTVEKGKTAEVELVLSRKK